MPSNDQPIGAARPRAALLLQLARRTSGHGPVTPDHATARISSDLWPAFVAWLSAPADEASFCGYRCVDDPTLPPDTVRLERTP